MGKALVPMDNGAVVLSDFTPENEVPISVKTPEGIFAQGFGFLAKYPMRVFCHTAIYRVRIYRMLEFAIIKIPYIQSTILLLILSIYLITGIPKKTSSRLLRRLMR